MVQKRDVQRDVRQQYIEASVSEPRSLADHFDQDTFRASAIELPVEDLFPRPEVKLTVSDGDHHFAPHDLPLQMRVGVVLSGSVVRVSRR